MALSICQEIRLLFLGIALGRKAEVFAHTTLEVGQGVLLPGAGVLRAFPYLNNGLFTILAIDHELRAKQTSRT